MLNFQIIIHFFILNKLAHDVTYKFIIEFTFNKTILQSINLEKDISC